MTASMSTWWSLMSTNFDDGYYHEPLGLRTDVDAGGAVTIARRRERDAVVAFLLRRASGLDPTSATTVLTLVKDISDGRHYVREDQEVQTLGQDRCV